MTAESDIAAIVNDGDVAPAAVNAALTSTLARADNLWLPSSVGEYDDYFTEDSSADYTEVTPTGSAFWNLRSDARLGRFRGVSGIATDQTQGDVSGYLKDLSGITTGDYIQTFLQGAGGLTTGERRSFGFVLASGTAVTSALAGVIFLNDASAIHPVIRHITGTFTAITSGTFRYIPSSLGGLHARVTFSATSTFRVQLSLNGEDFWLPIEANITSAFTPTHGGWIVSSDGETAVSSAIQASYFHSNVTA